MRFNYFLLSSFLLFLTYTGRCQTTKAVYNDSDFVSTVLKQNNTYRNALELPALTWSPALAQDALAWAQHLAKIDNGQHDRAIIGKEGENLWWGTADAFSYTDMVSALRQGYDRALYADGVEEYAGRWVCAGFQWEDGLSRLPVFTGRECDRAEALLNYPDRVAFCSRGLWVWICGIRGANVCLLAPGGNGYFLAVFVFGVFVMPPSIILYSPCRQPV
jgi:hypothetical protein